MIVRTCNKALSTCSYNSYPVISSSPPSTEVDDIYCMRVLCVSVCYGTVNLTFPSGGYDMILLSYVYVICVWHMCMSYVYVMVMCVCHGHVCMLYVYVCCRCLLSAKSVHVQEMTTSYATTPYHLIWSYIFHSISLSFPTDLSYILLYCCTILLYYYTVVLRLFMYDDMISHKYLLSILFLYSRGEERKEKRRREKRRGEWEKRRNEKKCRLKSV